MKEKLHNSKVQVTCKYGHHAHLQNDWWDGKEFAWRCELDTVVHLFPVCEQARFALVWCLKGSALHCV